MSIRTSVTLDDDVAARVKRESQSRGASFRDTLNDLLRAALLDTGNKARAGVRSGSSPLTWDTSPG
jgi:Arc/MetJ family transcription regulator